MCNKILGVSQSIRRMPSEVTIVEGVGDTTRHLRQTRLECTF